MDHFTRFRAALAATVFLACVACGEAPEPEPDTATPERDATLDDAGTEIDRVYQTFSRAYAEADVQLLMDSVYAPGGFYLPPGSPILRGQDQFRGQFSFLERFTGGRGPGPDISFDIVDRDVSGDLAYDIGVYTLRSPLGPGDEPGRGKFIVIWKRNADGDWRIHADGFSGLD
jgi:ketosteroid isomerase-like protein